MTAVVGIDVGGTFTDFVLWQDGKRTIHKILSTHPQPEIGVLTGLKELGILGAPDKKGTPGAAALKTAVPTQSEGQIDIIHGSTIATNALLERKGARIALITTDGFIDLIDIGRQNRAKLYSFFDEEPVPLVDKAMRFGVVERIGSSGEVIKSLDVGRLADTMRALKEGGAEAVAICLLFSFLNPRHEIEIEKYLEEAGLFVSASYKVLPEYREYERLSTTVINAFVTPLVASYLSKLSAGLGAGLSQGFRIMQSNGGLASAAAVSKQAVQTVLSGPAGGAVATERLGVLTGVKRLVSFDMGGTSTDVSLIDGALQLTTEFSLYRSPVKTPMVDITTVGAGGGSIAWFDVGGALQVGPESAGSNPGPAAYGKGGRPTITDANLVLGRLHPDHFLGGRQKLDSARAEAAVETLCSSCGLDVTGVAEGIIKVAISNMQKAVRKVSVERGYDPRDFTLVAFGGAGPMHACELAEAALIPRVLIPKTPGVFSALGMTTSDVTRDYSKSILKRRGELAFSNLRANSSSQPSSRSVAHVLEELFQPLLNTARSYLYEEGISKESVELQKALDIRYAGQSFELTIPLADYTDDFEAAFHGAHLERYGHASPGEEVELVAARVRAIGRRGKPDEAKLEKAKEPASPVFSTAVFFSGWHNAPAFERDRLLTGHAIYGPALVFQLDSTVVIPPGWLAQVDDFGNLVLEAGQKRAGQGAQEVKEGSEGEAV